MIFKILISGKSFNIQGHCDLELRPSDCKSSMGHLIVMTNHLVEYRNLLINSFQENEQTPFYTFKVTVTFTFDLLTTNSIGVINLHVKYEQFVINDFQNNQQKPYTL